MLRFFRQLRKKLIEQDNVRKPSSPAGRYLFYAVGEIFLVVIGILIALQINTWNENRKNIAMEIDYLSRLYDELDKNKSYGVLYKDFSNYQVESSEILSNALRLEDDKIETSVLIDALIQCLQIPYPNYSDNVWQELKSTGDLSLLHNKDLSSKLSDYFNYIEQAIELENEWAAFHLSYREMTNEILDFSNRNRIINNTLAMGPQKGKVGLGTIVFDESDYKDLQVKSILESLRDIGGLSGVLSDININKSVGKIVHKKIEENSTEVQRLIEAEIKSLSN